MKKKQIDTQALVDELRPSAFFRRETPLPEASPAAADPTSPALPAAEDARTSRPGRTSPTPIRPTKRTMVRHPFEVYQDQVEQLRELALRERMHGGAGSMSKMVRDAIDRIIEERRRAEES